MEGIDHDGPISQVEIKSEVVFIILYYCIYCIVVFIIIYYCWIKQPVHCELQDSVLLVTSSSGGVTIHRSKCGALITFGKDLQG